MIVIAHNYVHVLEMCDRVNLLRNGRIELDKRTDETPRSKSLTRDRGRRVPAATAGAGTAGSLTVAKSQAPSRRGAVHGSGAACAGKPGCKEGNPDTFIS